MHNSNDDPSNFEFSTYTDSDILRERIQACEIELFGGPVPVISCTLLSSRYKSYENPASKSRNHLTLCIRVTLGKTFGETAQREVLLYGKVFIGGRSRLINEEFRSDSVALPLMASKSVAPIHLPTLDMLVWRFPDDPGMPHLTALTDPHRAVTLLPQALAGERSPGPQDLDIRVVKYHPEKTATLCYSWPTIGTEATGNVVYAKAYCDGRGRATYQRMRHFWNTDVQRPQSAVLHLPEPLEYNGNINTLWTPKIAGTPLAQTLTERNHIHLFAQVGAGIAAIHQSMTPCEKTLSLDDIFQECTKKVRKLGRINPLFAEALSNAMAQLGYVVDKLQRQECRLKPLHGDFHIDQLIVAGGVVYFLDFDAMALGDPEQDLAEFIVELLFRDLDNSWAQTLTRALLVAYEDNVSWSVRRERLYWHALVEYIGKTYRCFIRQEPGWAQALQGALANLYTLDDLLLS